MAQRSNFQIDDIKINKRGNAFFMDIDATLDEPNQIRKLNISDVELCNDGTLELKESKKPRPEISIEEAERLLKCKIVRE